MPVKTSAIRRQEKKKKKKKMKTTPVRHFLVTLGYIHNPVKLFLGVVEVNNMF